MTPSSMNLSSPNDGSASITGPALSEGHARALVEILQALEPDYRPGLRWDAMLFHALFGVPALKADTAAITSSHRRRSGSLAISDRPISRRTRPDRAAAHEAAEAFIAARRAGIYLARIPQEALKGLIDGLESATVHATRPS